MSRRPASLPHDHVSDLLVRKAAEHFPLQAADEAALRKLEVRTQSIRERADIVRQGDYPTMAVIVLGGMLARYHTLAGGDRQYLSFHIRGDMPDVQSLFLKVMDHSVCALNDAEIAQIRHDELLETMRRRPNLCFAFWRSTLTDAAIFRQAVTNVGSRTSIARVAHFFCEQMFRATQAKLAEDGSCSLPLSQEELGQTLGLSLVSINRTLQQLRKQGLLDFRAQRLVVKKWAQLVAVAGFDPAYLYAAKDVDLV